ncbi:hypothetical protein NUSPORA_01608 [Nucleospora cyclopteri]
MLVKSREKSKMPIKCSRNLDEYCFEEKINTGTFGEVSLYKNRTGMRFAIKKFIYKNSGTVHLTTLREIKNLLKLDCHQNLIRIEEIVVKNGVIYAVFPFYKKSLSGLKYEFMKDLKNHFKQILNGVRFMHDKKIIHRDLKAANILIDSRDTIKIIDMGMSRTISPTMTSLVTTLWYRAPELLEFGTKACYTSYDCSVDIWSLGIILLEMLIGQPPFKGNSEIEQLKMLKKELLNLNNRFYFLNEDAKEILKGMLNFNPKERFSIEEILESQFLQNIDLNEKVNYL